jgi:hypothetical protein
MKLRDLVNLVPISLAFCFSCSSGTHESIATNSSACVGGDQANDGGTWTRPARDWWRYPVVREVDRAREIWAISDIHADYNALLTLFAGAKLIEPSPPSPREVRWTGGFSTLVVVGDMIDRGPDAVDVLRLLITLHRRAPFHGGRVVVTMGNHEAEFLANPENGAAEDADVGVDRELIEAGYDLDATAEGDDNVGRFMRNLPIAARVDDWFFVHAGNTQGQTIAQITAGVRAGVDAAGFGAPVLSATTSILETKFTTGPQWWEATGSPVDLLTTWTEALGVRHLVMGHQPQAVAITGGVNRPKDIMASEYGGLLFFIDTGMSIDVDKTGGALLHVTDVGTPAEAWTEVKPDGSVVAL